MSGKLFVVSGPSGAGKSTIIRKVKTRIPDLGYSVSHTTRAPRSSEKNGVDYHFVDRKTFRKMIEDDTFVEWAEVYDGLYGTSFPALDSQVNRGLDVVLDLDSQGARNIRNHFRDSTLIFILPPSLEELEKRLRERAQDSDTEIDRRLQKVYREMEECGRYDFFVINDDLGKAVNELESIIIAHRCSKERLFPIVRKILSPYIPIV